MRIVISTSLLFQMGEHITCMDSYFCEHADWLGVRKHTTAITFSSMPNISLFHHRQV